MCFASAICDENQAAIQHMYKFFLHNFVPFTVEIVQALVSQFMEPKKMFTDALYLDDGGAHSNLIQLLLKLGHHPVDNPEIIFGVLCADDPQCDDLENTVLQLIEHNCDVNFNDDDRHRETALLKSIIPSRLNIFKALIRAGADVNLPNTPHNSPLDLAISEYTSCLEDGEHAWLSRTCFQMIQILINHAQIHFTTIHLLNAIQTNLPGVVRRILECKEANINFKYNTRYKKTILNFALESGCRQNVKMLLEHGVKLETEQNFSEKHVTIINYEMKMLYEEGKSTCRAIQKSLKHKDVDFLPTLLLDFLTHPKIAEALKNYYFVDRKRKTCNSMVADKSHSKKRKF
jgi:hypothetical protein